MNKIEKYQLCADENELALFVEGTLTGERLKFVKQHLESCSLCNESVRLAMELSTFNETPDLALQDKGVRKFDANPLGKFISGAAISGAIIDILSHGNHIPMVAENNLSVDASFLHHEDSIIETNYLTNMETPIHEAQNQFGEEAKIDVSSDVYQGYPDTCAVRSQQLVLNDFGIPVTQEDLIKEATLNGWYAEGQGTPLEYVGNLLESHGVQVNKFENANIFNITNELAQGHKVIIGVDANELWHNGFLQDAKDSILGDTPNHALIVAGIDTSDPNHAQVILEDPGTGDVAKSYPIDQFMDAWKDSNCFMVSTQEPAPPFAEGMENFDYAYLNRLPQVAGVPYPEFETFHQLSNSEAYSHDHLNQVYAGFNAVTEGEKFTDVLSGLISHFHTPAVLSNLTHLVGQLKDSLWSGVHEPDNGEHQELSAVLNDASVAHNFSDYFSAMHDFHSLGDTDSNPFHNDDIANWYHEQV